MSVILVNGSPNAKGCIYTGLTIVAKVLNSHGIKTEIFQTGKKPISQCIGCNVCAKTQRCFKNDVVNKFLEIAPKFDGYIFGSPVHYAAPSSQIKCFMDRAFFYKTSIYDGKPAAAIASCRRGGASATLDMLNKYFQISNMPIVGSQYWNMIHGFTAEDVYKDEEGCQTLRTLGENMAYLIKCIKAGKEAGVPPPKREPVVFTNFINSDSEIQKLMKSGHI